MEKRKQALLFLQKKKQKNFVLWDLALLLPTPAVNRSFLVLFFKKELLSCASNQPLDA